MTTYRLVRGPETAWRITKAVPGANGTVRVVHLRGTDGPGPVDAAAKLDVRVISPHAMRHTFASILAQRGVSLFKIAAWMGHSTAQVTELYAHLTAYDDDIGRLNNPTPAEKVAQQPVGKPA